ncbi:MAG: transporter substrate-binding domain-containing protein [Chloroflexi bacterium]|nr:transporter substrate-binding domain-containing protein [Chloroflexota bacterium]
MKKSTAPLALLLVMLLTGCSTLSLKDVQRYVSFDSLRRVVTTPEAVAIDSTSTPVPPDYSTAALIKLRSRVRIGIRFDAPPLASVNGQGDLEGFDVDLGREFARRWLGSEKNVEFVQVTSKSAPGKVRSREVDLAMGGLVHSKAAEVDADFSLTYLYDGEALLVRAGTFADFASLAGRNIAFIDDVSTFALRDAQNAAGVTVTTQIADSYSQAYSLVSSGNVDAMIGRWRRLRTRAASDSQLAVMQVLRREPIGILTPPNDSEFADLVNITLSNMMLDGTYAQLYRKHFGADPDMTELAPLTGPIELQLAQLLDVLQTDDRLAAVRTAGRLRVGYRIAAPFVQTADDGTLAGYEVDLVRNIARRILGSPDAVDWVAFDGDPATAWANFDLIIGGYDRTQAIERAADLSLPTYIDANRSVALLVPPRQSPLRDAVNAALQQMIADNTFTAVHGRWFPDQVVMNVDVWP